MTTSTFPPSFETYFSSIIHRNEIYEEREFSSSKPVPSLLALAIPVVVDNNLDQQGQITICCQSICKVYRALKNYRYNLPEEMDRAVDSLTSRRYLYDIRCIIRHNWKLQRAWFMWLLCFDQLDRIVMTDPLMITKIRELAKCEKDKIKRGLLFTIYELAYYYLGSRINYLLLL